MGASGQGSLSADCRAAATSQCWIYRGQVTAALGDYCVVHADAAELAKLRAHRARHRRWTHKNVRPTRTFLLYRERSQGTVAA